MYDVNATTYISKLVELKDEMKNTLSEIESKNIITFHEAFPYFAKDLGLNIVAIIESISTDTFNLFCINRTAYTFV